MNRNLLKIIAVISMLVDHIGAYLFPNILIFRIIGRLAFPIFAIFIAEGWKFTKSKKKYFLTIFLFACISQIPYVLLGNGFKLNILFTFIISLSLMYFIEIYKNNSIISMICIGALSLISLIGSILGIIDYGFLGILIPVAFYFITKKWFALLIVGIILSLMALKNLILAGLSFKNAIQLFSILSLILLVLYNKEKGKLNLKYFFYIFYPAHLLVIYLVQILVV